jgi:sensor histidine kinase YesM
LDSVLSEEKKVELTRKDMQFKLEKQETIANAEIKRQSFIKNTAIAGGGILFLATIFGYILYKKKRDALEEKKIADFNTKVAETELKALRSQMNPHFIFNSLNSISDYMAKHNIDIANDYLIKFSKLTRSILENSEKKWISLKDDLELTELYIQMESLRLKNKFSYDIKVDKAIVIENTLIPPLI